MAVNTRFNAIINQPTTLQFQLLKNGVPFSAYSVSKVEIYDNITDATNSTNAIEVIPSGSITESTSGLYTYTAAAISTVGTYFDKIFLVPENGLPEETFVNNFYVQEFGSGTPPIIVDKVLITGTIMHPDCTPDTRACVIVEPERVSELNSANTVVTVKPVKARTNELGQWYVNIPSSSSIGNVRYRFTIKSRHINVTTVVTVPDLVAPATEIKFEDLFVP